MKRCIFTILIGILPGIYFLSPTYAEHRFGDSCSTICDCCELMMEFLDRPEVGGELYSLQETSERIGSFPSLYDNGDWNTQYLLNEMLNSPYFDIELLSEAWYYGIKGGWNSAEEACDWASGATECSGICNRPAGPEEQQCESLSEDSWYPDGSGIDAHLQTVYVCTQCLDTPDLLLRCSAGYYGYPYEDGSGGCTACPTPGTSNPDSGSLTQCFIKENTSFSDTSGKGIYTDNCYYTR